MSATNADRELARLREEARKADDLEDGKPIPSEIPQYLDCLRDAIGCMAFLYIWQEWLEREGAESESCGFKRERFKSTDKIDASRFIQDYEKHFKKPAPPELRELDGRSLKEYIQAKLDYYPDVLPKTRNKDALLKSLINALRFEAAIEKLPHPLSDTERAAFRAGWHLKEADLVANLSRARAKEMGRGGPEKLKQRGPAKKTVPFKTAIFAAHDAWKADSPEEHLTDFFVFIDVRGAEFELSVNHDGKICFEGVSKTEGSIRRWLKKRTK